MSQALKDYNYQDRKHQGTLKSQMREVQGDLVECKMYKPKDDNRVLSKQNESQGKVSEVTDFRAIAKTKESQDQDVKVHKITLQEYRERTKSKSPNKVPPTTSQNTTPTGVSDADTDKVKNKSERTMSIDISEDKQNPSSDKHQIAKFAENLDASQKRSERAMSTDELSEMSFDMANMSIDDSDDKVCKTGDIPLKEADVMKEKTRDENKLKLKKALSSTNCSSEPPTSGSSASSKLYSSLPSAKPKTETNGRTDFAIVSSDVDIAKGGNNKLDDVSSKNNKFINLPLSERIKIKAGSSQSELAKTHQSIDTKQKLKHGDGPGSQASTATEVIDLTEDDENDKLVKPKATKDLTQQFGKDQSGRMATFQSLNKQSSLNQQSSISQDNGEISTVQSQQWTQMRGQTGTTATSGSQHGTTSFKSASQALSQSLQEDIRRRNELTRLLDKQKV